MAKLDNVPEPDYDVMKKLICLGEDLLMNEVIFLVEDAPDGGFIARALGLSIFTQADSITDLHDKVRDAVRCHFDEGKAPKVVRLHHVREEVIAV